MKFNAAAAFMVLIFVGGLASAAEKAGLAAVPPMGWNSWNHFAEKVSDAVIRAQADAMVKSGMRDAGYVYVNIDDTWEGKRDAQGVIHPNEKFPDMKALADYVHSKGLKLGLYSSPGPKTCAEFEGSLGHEEQDARTYAAWGIDYLKYDYCSFVGDAAAQIAAYKKMGDALKKTGRPIVYSLCQYGRDTVWNWGASVGGNMWRTTGDISDNYYVMSRIGFSQVGIDARAGPGHWNDPDMLEVGNGHMTSDEYRTHMSLWALLAAPLLAGNDVSSMTAETSAMLMNPEVIAVDQDSAGAQGRRIFADGELEVWSRPLANGDVAVGLFNREEHAASITAPFAKLGIKGAGAVRDLWLRKELGLSTGGFAAEVPAHGAVFIRVKPT